MRRIIMTNRWLSFRIVVIAFLVFLGLASIGILAIGFLAPDLLSDDPQGPRATDLTEQEIAERLALQDVLKDVQGVSGTGQIQPESDLLDVLKDVQEAIGTR